MNHLDRFFSSSVGFGLVAVRAHRVEPPFETCVGDENGAALYFFFQISNLNKNLAKTYPFVGLRRTVEIGRNSIAIRLVP